jgi:BirA family biotin operon repressor/biotin-[acetyl-CoA-carboxylase] ligase
VRTAAGILKMLREGAGPVSGGRMASRLGLTRAAVWKAVQSLRDQGFDIQGVPNQGYTLLGETDRLSAPAIGSRLSGWWEGADIRVREALTSTNTLAKGMLTGRGKLILAANSQTAGRGRRGRSFFSPPGSGLYFSMAMAWEREEPPVLVTTMAAVAVARVLERELEVQAGIKWVNDLYWQGKKIGGILTEAVTGLESGLTTSLVTGIGLNLTEPEGGYPGRLSRTAGPLLQAGARVDRNRLIALIANEQGQLIQQLPDRSWLDFYRDRCFILGHKVRLDTGQIIIPHAISDEGALLYREGGQVRSLATGEVSILL